MKAILLALWLLLWANLNAEPVVKDTSEINKKGALVKGTVKSESGKALESATVILMSVVDSLKLSTSSTDKNGVFEFKGLTTGRYYITIHHVGYSVHQSQSFFIKSENDVVDLKMILLNMHDEKLKEVVIRAVQKPFIEHKIDRTIVNVGSLISNTGTTAIEVLNNVPGIEVVDDVILLRGKQGVTVYIDDKQSFLQGKELLNYLKALPSGMLDLIELMPNPPAKYRTNGGAGVINIKTKKNSTQGLNGNFSASQSRGRYSRSNYNMNLNYKKNKFNIFEKSA